MKSEIIDSLRKRYPDIFPLVFLRTIEMTKTPGAAFDVFETMPKSFPIVWNEEKTLWETTDNILQIGS